ELGPPISPRAVVHGHLGYQEAAPRGEDRDEAVELPVESDLLHGLPPVDLEAGVEIVEPHAGEPAGYPVEESGWPSLGARVLAILLPTRHEVESVLEAGEQLGDFGRIVLEVGVEGHDDVALRLAKSDGQCRGLAEVPTELDASDVGVLDGQLLNQ